MLFGKSFLVRSITTEKPKHFGQLHVNKGELLFRSWRLKHFSLNNVETIEGYLETTPGLEEVCCVDFIFTKGNKICFDGSKTEQQAVIDQLLLQFCADPINWDSQCGPFTSNKLVLYRKLDIL
jgi:hypothetical protein